MKKFITWIITAMLAVLMTACAPQTTVEKASLSDGNVIMLCDTTGTITLSSKSKENIEWRVSNNSVVQVSANAEDNRYANITALDAGVAIIEACQGEDVFHCTVKVVALALERAEGAHMTLDMKDGYVSQNIAVFTNFPDDGKLFYYSDNLQVAYVQNNGTVVAVGVGETTVTAQHPSGLKYTVTVKVINTATAGNETP